MVQNPDKVVTMNQAMRQRRKRILMAKAKSNMKDFVIKNRDRMHTWIGHERHVCSIFRDNLWAGRPCVIVGGGPSLRDFDWSLLDGFLTIGINRAFEKFDPTIVFSIDTRFWSWVETGKFGKKVTERFANYDAGYKVWVDTSRRGLFTADILVAEVYGGEACLSPSISEGIAPGNSSGYAALNLALCLGADPIYLLGFDMFGDPNNGHQSWWHNGYPIIDSNKVYENSMLPWFDAAAPAIAETGKRVYNLNPESHMRCFPFLDAREALDAERSTGVEPVFVSFYTEDTPYENEARKLIKTLKRLGLRYHVEGVPSQGSWLRNVGMKPAFLRRMYERFGSDNHVVWVDADAEVQSTPTLFRGDEISEPVGVHYRNGKELLSGTIFLRKGEPVVPVLLRKWDEECRDRPEQWDQRNLDAVIQRGSYAVRQLPAAYTCIFDTMAGEVEQPVIEHYQASRRLALSRSL